MDSRGAVLLGEGGHQFHDPALARAAAIARLGRFRMMPSTTSRLGLAIPLEADSPGDPVAWVTNLGNSADAVIAGFYSGTFANRATVVPSPSLGMQYWATDQSQLYFYTGSAWVYDANLPTVESFISGAVTPAASTYTAVTSVSLPAGTWEVSAPVGLSTGVAVSDAVTVWLSTATASVTGLFAVGSQTVAGSAGAGGATHIALTPKKLVLATTTSVFLNMVDTGGNASADPGDAVFGIGSGTATGIHAVMTNTAT